MRRAARLALVAALLLAGCAAPRAAVDEGADEDEPLAAASDDAPRAPPRATPSPSSDAAGEPAAVRTSTVAPPPPSEEATLAPPAPSATIAFIDQGINPYHVVFRDASPRAQQHPSTYIPGYPADAQPLHLSFGHVELKDALRADCALWLSLQPNTLYYVPGTRIVGAISFFGEVGAPRSCDDVARHRSPYVFDTGGHGTMVASRAAGAGYGACAECFVVAAQGFGLAAVEWAAAQPWIDAQSNSWGPIVF
ncbi:MAG TPA: hypothetical protein VM582_10505, partial [Candidatus Thermoplasmatota archaeon]|nr:hypothetical protein [Candidatus Thermoplasmatota archaeon]